VTKVYSLNNVTAKQEDDGSIVIYFREDPKQSNFIPITKGWTYTVRLYRLSNEIFGDSWKLPEAQQVR